MRRRGVVPGRKADPLHESQSEWTVSPVRIEVASGKATEVSDRGGLRRGRDLGDSVALSPDGALLAGVGHGGDILICRWRAGRHGASPRTGQVSSRGASPSAGRSDGRHLFIHRVGDVPGREQKLDLATGRLEPWRDLTPEDPAGLVRINPVRVAPDGRSWAYTYIRVLSNLYVVDGLK